MWILAAAMIYIGDPMTGIVQPLSVTRTEDPAYVGNAATGRTEKECMDAFAEDVRETLEENGLVMVGVHVRCEPVM